MGGRLVGEVATSEVGRAILLGLVVGKPLGIVAFTQGAVLLRAAVLPDGMRLREVLVAGCFAGMGFAVSWCVSTRAFFDQGLLYEAKAAIFVASALALLLGLGLGLLLARPLASRPESSLTG